MELNNLEIFLAKIKRGELAVGCVVSYTDIAVSETIADTDYDFCWIDGEHGEFDRETAMHHIMALRGTSCAPIYRVPACSHTEIKRIIDFAPAGIIVPMILSAEEARLAVAACRYPPEGNRGCGFRRGIGYGAKFPKDYWEISKHDPLVILQIEHIEAYRNLDEILAVPGIDGCIIGPYDFTASMGKPGQWDDPEVTAVLDDTCARIRKAGILLGAYAEVGLDKWIQRGVQFISIFNDTGALVDGLRRARQNVLSLWDANRWV